MYRFFISLFCVCFLSVCNQKQLQAKPKSRPGIQQQIPSNPPLLTLNKFKKLCSVDDIQVLDTRYCDDFLQGFVPNSINISFEGPFDHFLTQVFPTKDQKFLLITDSENNEAVIDHLIKLGYINIVGVLEGGIETWKSKEMVASLSTITAREFNKKSVEGHIVDVRTEKEFKSGHIDNAMNIPLTDLVNFGSELRKDYEQLYIYCQSGYRSTIALSILSSKGFKNICNIQGGYKALKKEEKENQ
ncbi:MULTISPECIES: rhodanese-like domain-containing protein [unclassified Sphingobacterium]|uniref:rhodanese-like domain-containing protein n=1 Tax=unclassified Sphingobacterium TaxID=2609468 RepID=UPI0025E0670C|nr:MULTISPECIES: rhodanese-like domain-containing protein [unclassified Sphingobacterium]